MSNLVCGTSTHSAPAQPTLDLRSASMTVTGRRGALRLTNKITLQRQTPLKTLIVDPVKQGKHRLLIIKSEFQKRKSGKGKNIILVTIIRARTVGAIHQAPST